MLPINILRMIYNDIIAPFLDYSISIGVVQPTFF